MQWFANSPYATLSLIVLGCLALVAVLVLVLPKLSNRDDSAPDEHSNPEHSVG
jgi:hypothetical protein